MITKVPIKKNLSTRHCGLDPQSRIAIVIIKANKMRNPMPLLNKQFYVYMVASKRNGTLYLGMSSDLIGRIYQHKNKLSKGFTSKYGVSLLVWYEVHSTAMAAIEREKQLKNWKRSWKLELIEKMNPDWHDLYEGLI